MQDIFTLYKQMHLLTITNTSCRNECKKQKAKQHEREKEYMKSLKQVKETGKYKTQKKDESSSEEEIEQNASDDGWEEVDVNTSTCSSGKTSYEDSAFQSFMTVNQLLQTSTKITLLK